ncbi:hypothetical protein OsI_28969 [Oryza sativa Indica Group]|uniref:Uncharacterized protein n=1 Tax=Oryza sativa subsp. indica TaxID=39946 RepID=B8BA28_ORYSI|nr:hypothetical protein OsI_28969 [Oryza sativa Indica Group]
MEKRRSAATAEGGRRDAMERPRRAATEGPGWRRCGAAERALVAAREGSAWVWVSPVVWGGGGARRGLGERWRVRVRGE